MMRASTCVFFFFFVFFCFCFFFRTRLVSDDTEDFSFYERTDNEISSCASILLVVDFLTRPFSPMKKKKISRSSKGTCRALIHPIARARPTVSPVPRQIQVRA